MSNILFKRNIQVIISDDSTEIKIPAKPFDEIIMARFNLENVANSNSSVTSMIELFNLNDNDLNFVADRAKNIEILAGYNNNNSIIYSGQIDNVEISKKRQDKITKLSLVTDTYNINNSNYSISYVGTKTIKEIVLSALSSISLPVNNTDLIPDNISLKNYAFSGQTKNLLNSLLRPYNLDWFINQQVLEITQIGQSGRQFIPLVSENTGMIGSPTLTTDGINVDSLLNENIIVGQTVKIKSNAETIKNNGSQTNNLKQAYNGEYKVTKVTHHGDSINGVFFTSFICNEITSNVQS